MPEDSLLTRVKRFRVYGTAILLSIALVSALSVVTLKVYAFAQKIETYVKLPEWLQRVEKKVDRNADEVKRNGEKLDELLRKRGLGQ